MSEESLFEAHGGDAQVTVSGFGWKSVAISRERVVFRNLVNEQDGVELGEVTLVVGELGMVAGEEEALSWKRLVVTTRAGRRFVTQFDPRTNGLLYRAFLAACPQALGVDAEGNVTIGAPPTDAAELAGWIEATARMVRKEFLRQGRGLLVGGVATGAGGLACIGVMLVFFLGGTFLVNILTGAIAVGAIALPFVSGVMMIVGARKLVRGVGLCRRIRATQEGRPMEEGVLRKQGWTPKGLPPEV